MVTFLVGANHHPGEHPEGKLWHERWNILVFCFYHLYIEIDHLSQFHKI